MGTYIPKGAKSVEDNTSALGSAWDWMKDHTIKPLIDDYDKSKPYQPNYDQTQDTTRQSPYIPLPKGGSSY